MPLFQEPQNPPKQKPNEQFEQPVALDEAVDMAEAEAKLPKGWLRALRLNESPEGHWKANGRLTQSPTGPRGAFQFTQSTGKQFGVNRDDSDAVDDIIGAAKYAQENFKRLRALTADDETAWTAAALAHNRGAGAVEKMIRNGKLLPEGSDGYMDSNEYVHKFLDNFESFRKGNAASPFPVEPGAEPGVEPGIPGTEPGVKPGAESDPVVSTTTVASTGQQIGQGIAQSAGQQLQPKTREAVTSTIQPTDDSDLFTYEGERPVAPGVFVHSNGAFRVPVAVGAEDTADSVINKGFIQVFKSLGLSEDEALIEAQAASARRQSQGRSGAYRPFTNESQPADYFEAIRARGKDNVVISGDDLKYIKQRVSVLNTEKFEQDFHTKYGGDPSRVNNAVNRLVSGFTGFASKGIHGLAALSASIDGLDTEADKTELYRQGTLLAQDAERLFPLDPRLQDEYISSKIPEALGSGVAMLSTGVAGGPVGIGVTAALSQAGSSYDEAKAAGATEQQATDAAWLGVPIGMTEMIPLANMANRLRGVFPGATKEGLRAALKSAGLISAKESGEELIQNTGQGVLTKVVSNYVYNSNKPIFGDVKEDAVVGLVTGFLLSGGTSGAAQVASSILPKDKVPSEKDTTISDTDIPPSTPAETGLPEEATSLPSEVSNQASTTIRVTAGKPVVTDKGSSTGATIADRFIQEQSNGQRQAVDIGNAEVPEPVTRQFADWYDSAKHEPDNPDVQTSYKALNNEVSKQYKFLLDNGYTIEPWTGEGEPYKNSAEMRKDVEENKHLYYFKTDNGFGEGQDSSKHPMLEPSEFQDAAGNVLLKNDIFRAVHDAFGHWVPGTEFGPRGEWNATRSHAQTLSPDALPALLAETQGQNSWVNAGPQLRNADGVIPQKGEPGYVEPKARPFAAQKAALPPKELVDAWLKHSQENIKGATVASINPTESSSNASFNQTVVPQEQAAPGKPENSYQKIVRLKDDKAEYRLIKEEKVNGKQRVTLVDTKTNQQRFASPREIATSRVVATKEAQRVQTTKNFEGKILRDETVTTTIEGRGKTEASADTISVDGVNVRVDREQSTAYRKLQQAYGDTIHGIRRMEISEEAKQTRLEEAKEKFKTLRLAIVSPEAVTTEKSRGEGWLATQTKRIQEVLPGNKVTTNTTYGDAGPPTLPIKNFTPVKLPNGKTGTVVGQAGAGKVRVRLDAPNKKTGQHTVAVVSKKALEVVDVRDRKTNKASSILMTKGEGRKVTPEAAKAIEADKTEVKKTKKAAKAKAVTVHDASGNSIPKDKRFIETKSGELLPVVRRVGKGSVEVQDASGTRMVHLERSGSKFITDEDAAQKGLGLDKHPGFAQGVSIAGKQAPPEESPYNQDTDSLGRPAKYLFKTPEEAEESLRRGKVIIMSGQHGQYSDTPGQNDTDRLATAFADAGISFNRVAGRYGETEDSLIVDGSKPGALELAYRLADETKQTQILIGEGGEFRSPFTTGPETGKENYGRELEVGVLGDDYYSRIYTPGGKLDATVTDVYDTDKNPVRPVAVSKSSSKQSQVARERVSIPESVAGRAKELTGTGIASVQVDGHVWASKKVEDVLRDAGVITNQNFDYFGVTLGAKQVEKLRSYLKTRKHDALKELFINIGDGFLASNGSLPITFVKDYRTVDDLKTTHSHETIHTTHQNISDQRGRQVHAFESNLTSEQWNDLEYSPEIITLRAEVRKGPASGMYGSASTPQLMAEIIAHFGSGDWSNLGVKDSTIEAAYVKVIETLHAKNKSLKISELTERFLNDDATNTLREITRTGRGEGAGSSRTSDDGGRAYQDSSNPGPGGASKGNKGRHEAPEAEVSPAENRDGLGDELSQGKDQIETEEFKKWFGDSKVVDEQGKPLRVYHGTSRQFSTFDLNQAGSNNDSGMWGTGFYFSPNKKMSKGYGDKLMPVYLSLQNPLVLRPDQNWPDIVNQPYDPRKTTHGKEGKKQSDALRQKLIDAGYDGVIQYEQHFTQRMVMPGKKMSQVVAFYPEQIKSATGNSGKFDSTNPDILAHGTSYKNLDPISLYQQSLAERKTSKLEEVAAALETRTRKALGSLTDSASDKQKLNRAKAIASVEIKYQLAEEQLGKNSGRTWYKDDVAKMEKGLANLYPELEDASQMSLFKSVIAFTSGAAKPHENLSLAAEVWEGTQGLTKPLPAMKPNGTAWGLRPQVTKKAVERIEKLIKEKGVKGTAGWLQSSHPVRELKQWNVAVSGKATDEKPGLMVFGPKYGAFALNLHGRGQEVTVDQWAMRSWRRWMGDFSRMGTIQTGSLTEAPGMRERKLIQDAMTQVAKDVSAETEIQLTPSEVQAMLWYYEQELWRQHGAKNQSQSYGGAIDKLLEKHKSRGLAEAGRTNEARGKNALTRSVRQGNGQGSQEKQKLTTKSLQKEIAAVDWEKLTQPVDENMNPVEGYDSPDYATTLFKDTQISDTLCTGFACAVTKLYPGRAELYGFGSDSNWDSQIAAEFGGHDFAVLDGRFIVDPWITEVTNGEFGKRSVFDLQDKSDAAVIKKLYGPRAFWGPRNTRLEDLYSLPTKGKEADTFHQILAQGKDKSQTETPEFKKWFGDSKVIDEQGKPLRVYHASGNGDFSIFKRRRGDVGIHFGTAGQAADRIEYKYRDTKLPEGSRTIPVYLRINNPLRLSDAGWWDKDNLSAELVESGKFSVYAVKGKGLTELRALIQKKGYDGIVYRNTGETDGAIDFERAQSEASRALVESQNRRGKPEHAYDFEDRQTPEYKAFHEVYLAQFNYRQKNAEDSYIVFDSTQIKSATGNSGKFDSSNLNILAQGLDKRQQALFDQELFDEHGLALDWYKNKQKFLKGSVVTYPVYHGTAFDFAKFSNKELGKSTTFDDTVWGHFFSDNPADAGFFSNFAATKKEEGFGAAAMSAEGYRKWTPNAGQNIVPAYVAIKNPYEISAEQWIDIREGKHEHDDLMGFRVALQDYGYDGIVITASDFGFSPEGSAGDKIYVVFDPKNIKSATGNRGTYNPKVNNLLAHGRSNLTIQEREAENKALAQFDRDVWLDRVLEKNPDGTLSAPALADFDTKIQTAQRTLTRLNSASAKDKPLYEKELRKNTKALLKFYYNQNPAGLMRSFIEAKRAVFLVGMDVAARDSISTGLYHAMEGLSSFGENGVDWIQYAANKVRGKAAKHYSPGFKAIAPSQVLGIRKGIVGIGTAVKEGVESHITKLLREGGIDDKVYSKLGGLNNPFARFANGVYRFKVAQDKPMREYARARSIYELNAIIARNLPKGVNKKAAFKAMMQTPDPRVLDLAERIAADAVFQSPNKVGEAVRTAFKAKNPLSKSADLLLQWEVPFVSTPANVMNKTLDYMGLRPIYLAARGKFGEKLDYELAVTKTNNSLDDITKRAVHRAFGRGLVGWGLMLLGMGLFKARLATPYLDDEEDQTQRNLYEAAGTGPGHVKLGDTWLDGRYLGPAGSLVLMGASIASSAEKRKELRTVDVLKTVGHFMTEQTPAVRPTMELMKDNSRGIISKIVQPESVIPPLAREVAVIQDRKSPLAMSGPARTQAADSEIERTKNAIKAKLPKTPLNPEFNRQSLPERKDALGTTVNEPNPLYMQLREDRTKEPVRNELMKYGVGLSKSPAKRDIDNNVTEARADLFKRRAIEGESSAEYLKAGINAPGYKGNEPEALSALASAGRTANDKLTPGEATSNSRLIVKSVEVEKKARTILALHPDLTDEQKREVLSKLKSLFSNSKADRTRNLGLPIRTSADADITSQLYSNGALLKATVEQFILESKSFKP